MHATRAADRRGQVGTGDRSERIRTYNFPQGRVSDHRINLTLYKIDRVMQGELDEFIDRADRRGSGRAAGGGGIGSESTAERASARNPPPARDVGSECKQRWDTPCARLRLQSPPFSLPP